MHCLAGNKSFPLSQAVFSSNDRGTTNGFGSGNSATGGPPIYGNANLCEGGPLDRLPGYSLSARSRHRRGQSRGDPVEAVPILRTTTATRPGFDQSGGDHGDISVNRLVHADSLWLPDGEKFDRGSPGHRARYCEPRRSTVWRGERRTRGRRYPTPSGDAPSHGLVGRPTVRRRPVNADFGAADGRDGRWPDYSVLLGPLGLLGLLLLGALLELQTALLS